MTQILADKLLPNEVGVVPEGRDAIGCCICCMTIEPKTPPSRKLGKTTSKVVICTEVMSLSRLVVSTMALCRCSGCGRCSREKRGGIAGFALAEVVVCIAILAIVFGGIINAYIQSSRRAEWSGYSLAAQALAIQHIEEIKACVWDPTKFTYEIDDYCTNLVSWTATNSGVAGYTNWTGYSTNILDLPISGTNWVVATNYITATCIQMTNLSASGVNIYKIRVNTVWPFVWGNTKRFFTNTIINYKAPNNPESI